MAFESVKNMIDVITRLKGDEVLVAVIKNDRGIQIEIIDLNRQNQLFNEGVDSDNNIVGFYSFTTQQFSGGLKKAGTPYTFHDTGEFFESFRVTTSQDFFEIIANPIKGSTNLFTKYTPKLVGLTEESKAELSQELTPLIIEHLKKILIR